MQTEEEAPEIRFRFSDFRAPDTATHAVDLTSLNADAVRIDLSLNVAIQEKRRQVLVGVKYSTYVESEDGRQEIGHVNTGTTFDIDNFEDLPFDESRGLALPYGLMLSLASLSVSMVRGFVVGKFGDHVFGRMVMPPIDTRDLVAKTFGPGEQMEGSNDEGG